jgi:hypothetical protein
MSCWLIHLILARNPSKFLDEVLMKPECPDLLFYDTNVKATAAALLLLLLLLRHAERSAIEEWLSRGNTKDPVTGAAFAVNGSCLDIKLFGYAALVQ